MDIPIRKLFLCLLTTHFALLVLHFLPQDVFGGKFDLNAEANIPTWYSSALLFSVALSSLGIYLSVKGAGVFGRRFWLFFCCFFLFLSLDEAAQFHEVIDRHTKLKWVFVYAPIAGAFFALSTYYFLVIRKHDRPLRRWVLSGLVVYAIGSMGLELVQYIAHKYDLLSPGLRQLEIVTEEGLELIGTSMVLVGCLRELNWLYRILRLGQGTE